ncbi:MAG: hypothetical protein KID00_12660 [Clostridium argentinense]|uniref:DUF3784 domain-containing protein n=1 Tax=Clostridium faecium TaxID=2762223 RepID=A0ABR8YWD5_9CLOT|nr:MULTISPECIES: hypothetical protein [Clostridium]MBD8048484.1 hypothetical protein [Clostridium faecium]MBS5824679.1 hypothetical protein [Clostridium argentinense]MDU1349309.1 hypothetical protein [Clostridium argentinense]
MKNLIVIILIATGILQFLLALLMPWKKIITMYEGSGKVISNKRKFIFCQRFLYLLIGGYMLLIGFLIKKNIINSTGEILIMGVSLMILTFLPTLNKYKYLK